MRDKDRTTLTIDNWRHRQDNAVAVIDHWVHGLVLNNVKIMPQVAVCLEFIQKKNNTVSTAQKDTLLVWPTSSLSAIHLVEAHELGGSVLFGLVERLEADVSGRFGCICERARDGVQVMGPDGHKAPLPTET